jgi:hypothetical protein
MGQRGRQDAAACSEEHFVDAWRSFYLQAGHVTHLRDTAVPTEMPR